jgi:hypothetical protein
VGGRVCLIGRDDDGARSHKLRQISREFANRIKAQTPDPPFDGDVSFAVGFNGDPRWRLLGPKEHAGSGFLVDHSIELENDPTLGIGDAGDPDRVFGLAHLAQPSFLLEPIDEVAQ